MKKNCGWIYEEQWTSEVGYVKRSGKGPGWHPAGGDTRGKSVKVTVVSKKGRQFFDEKTTEQNGMMTDRRWWLKKSSFFQEKIGATPSVADPGDTNPSDATSSDLYVFSPKIKTRCRISGAAHLVLSHCIKRFGVRKLNLKALPTR